MSLNDFVDFNINENESNDRSLTEWNFGNSLKYWTEENAKSSLDINDVSLEFVQSDTSIQNPKNSGKYFTDAPENFTEKKISPLQNNVQETFSFKTVSLNRIPTTDYQKKEKVNSVEASCVEYSLVSESSLHNAHLQVDKSLESNIKNFPVVSNSSHLNKDKMASNENLNLPSYCTNEIDNNSMDRPNPLRRYYSTLSLKEPTTNSKVLTHNSSHTSISKSRSLSNLSMCKPVNYDNIQSKVKKYIQEQKRESKLRRDSKASTKSLPVTPVRSIASRGFLDLDEDYLENLCLSRKKEKEELPEDLKKIKQEIHEGNVDIKLVEKLFDRLEKERECRIGQEIILNAFQLHYNNLLGKYAEAKNDIDQLRFNKITNDEYSKSDKKITNFKKAFSTSNIFAECAMPYEPLPNLVRYSSSPQVHPEVAEECHHNSEGNLPHLNESFINDCSFSNLSTSFKEDWYEIYNHLKQKLKEFIILEKNSAFNKEEEKTVWNYILRLYCKLSKGMLTENHCKLKLEEMHESISVVARSYSLHFPQNISINENSKSVMCASGFCENLPTSSSYPKILNESRYQDKPEFLKSDYSALTYNSRPNDKSKLSFLKYSNARDADSGCPPSDRSTRNSQFPSFDPFESLGPNGIENEASLNLNECRNQGLRNSGLWRRQSIDNLLQVSGNSRTVKGNPKKKYYLRNSRSKSLMNLDENYDASGSSEFEDSISNDDKTRKYLRKKHLKSLKTSKYLSKYEDRFIYQDQIVSSDSHSSKYEGSKCRIDMSQIEKNSKYFKHQVKDLKSKGLLQSRNEKSKRYSLPNRPNTPLKALADEPLKLARISLDAEDLSKMSLASNKKHGAMTVNRPPSNLSIYGGRINTVDIEEPRLCNENSFSFTQKSRDRFPSASTPKSSFRFDDYAQSKGRCQLPSDFRLDKSKRSGCSSNIGDYEMPNERSRYSLPHCCNGKPYVMICCHSNQLPRTQCLQGSCEHKAAMNSAKTEVDSPKLMTCLSRVTEQAESLRMNTQASLNLLRSKMLPVTRR